MLKIDVGLLTGACVRRFWVYVFWSIIITLAFLTIDSFCVMLESMMMFMSCYFIVLLICVFLNSYALDCWEISHQYLVWNINNLLCNSNKHLLQHTFRRCPNSISLLRYFHRICTHCCGRDSCMLKYQNSTKYKNYV